MELWTTAVSLPGHTTKQAVRAEAEGWHGLAVVDSQNLAADTYVCLALAATATSRLRLATGVTNPVTRHPAVTASAIAAIQAVSVGRAVLGIGRGDSALAHLGLAPAPVSVLERYLERVQAYLRGEDVSFDAAGDGHGLVPQIETLRLAAGPSASRLHWLRGGAPKVPVAVAATGPRVIAAAARHAERITFAVGADPERVDWAISRARSARQAAGLDPDAISLGAWICVLPHPELDVARRVASFARFSAMHGRATGPLRGGDREVLEGIHDAYDMRAHFTHGSPQSARLTDDFVDRYAVLGPTSACIERLEQLAALGLDHFVLVTGAAGADPEELVGAHERIVEQILPALAG